MIQLAAVRSAINNTGKVILSNHINHCVKEAIEEGVAYVPGTHFYPYGGHHNTFRLNFSNSTPEQIKEGMAKLRKLFEAHM
jgi:DNA-binding transcriptional MocR family regulator